MSFWKPLVIVKPTGQEGFGIGAVRDEVVRKCVGKVTPRGSGERVNGQRVEHTTTHSIEVRYSPDANITSECAVLCEGRRFEIKSVVNVGELNSELMLLCDEVS